MGERLVRARELAGMTVDDVVFQTKISRSVVEALEAGDFTVFSSPAYARSFLAQYSSLLQVDAALWINALEPGAYLASDSSHAVWVPAAREPVEKKKPERNPTGGWVAALGVLAISCLLIFLAMKGYRILEEKLAGESATGEATAASENPTEISPAVPAAAPQAARVPEEIVEPTAPRPKIVRLAE